MKAPTSSVDATRRDVLVGEKSVGPFHSPTGVRKLNKIFKAMKSNSVRAIPVVALLLVGGPGVAVADTSGVKGPAPVIVGKTGRHCKDDPNCFNRIHYAVKPVGVLPS